MSIQTHWFYALYCLMDGKLYKATCSDFIKQVPIGHVIISFSPLKTSSKIYCGGSEVSIPCLLLPDFHFSLFT